MTVLRNSCTGPAPVHFFQRLSGAALGVMLAAAPLWLAPAAAAPAPVAANPAGQGVDEFYRARNGAPLWFAPSSGDAADQLVALLSTASLDGLEPDKYHAAALQQAIAAARGGKRKDVDAADRALSDAFVAYVSDLRHDPNLGIMYVDAALRPAPPSPRAALIVAANAPSLAAYVRDLAWMNPMYGELRHALANHGYATDHERQLLAVNLERARALPAGKQRYILVNAAQQRLYTYEDGKRVDSMVVVVGKPKYPTPLITAYVRFASLNPYWYVPPDLAAERIAPKVVKQGMRYLDDLGYQVLSDWSPEATIIDPTTIDWKAVAAGKTEVLIRQLPGPHNSMGRMKFMFPNSAGIYLHDNPERELFTEASRLYSGGCVRLEDAARLGKWLFGRDLDWESAGTEEMVPLATPVPVYITYLTAMPDESGSSIVYSDDVYGRDAERLARMQSSAGTVTSASR
ncbi:MAG: L,D-transpeptidase YcbB [Sphingomonadales bacterium]|nr:L,D-transpeptidase YcbB [Sphingomonadales bacterium]